MRALWSDGERCHGVLTDAEPIAAAATVLATGGAAALWRRTTNPRGAIGAGPVIAATAGADLADLEFCQFHPTALALPGHRVRRRPDHRGRPRRGSDPARRRGAPLHRRARAARRGHRGDPRPDRGRRRPERRASTCAGSTRRASRTSSPRLRRPASRRRPSRSRSRRPPTTRWAGSRSTSTAAPRCPGSSPSASAPAPASTAPTGSPRTRSASASSSAAAPAAPPRPRSSTASARRSPSRRFEPPERERPGTPSGSSPGRCAAPSSWTGCSPTPTRSRSRSRPPRWSARSRAGATCGPTSRSLDPALDGIHIIVGPDGSTRREAWL